MHRTTRTHLLNISVADTAALAAIEQQNGGATLMYRFMLLTTEFVLQVIAQQVKMNIS